MGTDWNFHSVILSLKSSCFDIEFKDRTINDLQDLDFIINFHFSFFKVFNISSSLVDSINLSS